MDLDLLDAVLFSNDLEISHEKLTPGDGNCFFHAILDIVEYPQFQPRVEQSGILRQTIYQLVMHQTLLESQRLNISPELLLDESDFKRLRNSNAAFPTIEYGMMFAKFTKIPMTFWKLHNSNLEEISSFTGENRVDQRSEKFRLHFLLCNVENPFAPTAKDINHYQALKPLDMPKYELHLLRNTIHEIIFGLSNSHRDLTHEQMEKFRQLCFTIAHGRQDDPFIIDSSPSQSLKVETPVHHDRSEASSASTDTLRAAHSELKPICDNRGNVFDFPEDQVKALAISLMMVGDLRQNGYQNFHESEITRMLEDMTKLMENLILRPEDEKYRNLKRKTIEKRFPESKFNTALSLLSGAGFKQKFNGDFFCEEVKEFMVLGTLTALEETLGRKSNVDEILMEAARQEFYEPAKYLVKILATRAIQ